MPRQPRIEIEGGLYHVMTRGNGRCDIFHSEQDHAKFLSLLKAQKELLPFFLYAYCLMTNHVHLLMERKTDSIGRIMHRVLTGYSQYYNRRYGKTGHLLQGRYKSILCQSEPYMGELVRYIHLNPVRAKMTATPEDYPYSSHRAYVGLAPAGIVDVDPVLRLFGKKRAISQRNFAKYVASGADMGYRPDLYEPPKGILGSEEFVDSAIHRIGDTGYVPRPRDGRLDGTPKSFDSESLIEAVEHAAGISRLEFFGSGKTRQSVRCKELMILSGRQLGANVATLAHITGLSNSNVGRRYTSAKLRLSTDPGLRGIVTDILRKYEQQ